MARYACDTCKGRGSVFDDGVFERGYGSVTKPCPTCKGTGGGEKVDATTPCPHPGVYHLSRDGYAVIRPNPHGANTCFARTTGYVVARIEPAYVDLGPVIVAGLNAAKEVSHG